MDGSDPDFDSLLPDETPLPATQDGWELLCEGVLRTEFGRQRSDALNHAMAQLTAETGKRPARLLPQWRIYLELFHAMLRRRFAAALGVILVITAAFVGWHSWNSFQRARAASPGLGILTSTQNVRWSHDSQQPNAGDILHPGHLKLETGLAEIEFDSGVKIAVEAPAHLTLGDSRAVELRYGKLAAEVSSRGRGFTVTTPNAKIVDLGTRFGVDAAARHCKADVFEGIVEMSRAVDPHQNWRLTPSMSLVMDSHSVRTAPPSTESDYPQPGRHIYIRPVNCGFDKKDFAVLGGVPANFGFWSGPAYLLTGPGLVQGIRPDNGPGMLRFLPPRPTHGSQLRDSVVWQSIDLRPHKELLARGDVEVIAFAKYNRVAGAGAKNFGLSFAAFRGSPATAATLWSNRDQSALAATAKELVSDDDPATWERIDLSAKLPAEAEFLVLELRAICPEGISAATAFPGHFADLADVYLSAPLRASAGSQIQ